MELETLELRDRRYRAQQALNLLTDESSAEERKALEAEIAHYQEICPHERAEELEGEWRCKDCDLQKATTAPEPETEPAPEPESAPEPEAEAAPAEETAEAAPSEEAAAVEEAEAAPTEEAAETAPEEEATSAEVDAGDEEPEKPVEDAT